MALVLASQSPRRRQLMALVAPAFEVDESRVDESALAAPGPAALAAVLARAKAREVFARRPKDVVIGCDTVVQVDEKLLGKPADAAEATAMLEALSGRRHFVHTGVCICPPGKAAAEFVETTGVDFAPLPKAGIAAYAATPEPYDKAGGYGIQGWAARYITGVQGCFYNVMGLPVAALYKKLTEMDLL